MNQEEMERIKEVVDMMVTGMGEVGIDKKRVVKRERMIIGWEEEGRWGVWDIRGRERGRNVMRGGGESE
jgi:hypothetical protein